MRKRILATLVAVPVLLATVATTASAGPTASTGPTALTWTQCAEGRAHCASVPVPIDHDLPDGEKIDIAIAKLPANDPATRRGTLVFHPGGPAAVLTEGGLSADRLTLLSDLRQWFDVVMFDSRGYGKSNQICDPALAPVPTLAGTAADYAHNQEITAAYGESCSRQNPALATHASAVDVAHDIDAIRAALGEDKIYYFGAQRVADQIDGSVLLTVAGFRHAAYLRDIRCVRDAVHRYLLDGEMPSPGTTCEAGPMPTVR